MADEQQQPSEAKAAKTKGKYRVLRPLNRNHKTYAVGQIVQLADEHAEPLVNHQVIEVATEEVPL